MKFGWKTLLWLGLAAAGPAIAQQESGGTLPVPTRDPQSWILDLDYPASALGSRLEGRVGIMLELNERGRPVACHITSSSGYDDLDSMTCTLMLRRASFRPATGAGGSPVRATWSTAYTWRAPGGTTAHLSRALAATATVQPFEVEVRTPRRAYLRPALVRLRYASGRVVECIVEESSGDSAFDQVACTQAHAGFPAPPVVSGIAPMDARSVQVAMVVRGGK